MNRQPVLRACGPTIGLVALACAGCQIVRSTLSDASAQARAPALTAPCRSVSSTVLSCQLAGNRFAPLEAISLHYTLEIPVRPELAPARPTPKLWGPEPPRVQCLTYRREACLQYRTSDRGFFGPLLVHLTYLKLPQSGGVTMQNFRVTVEGAKGDRATIVLPSSYVAH